MGIHSGNGTRLFGWTLVWILFCLLLTGCEKKPDGITGAAETEIDANDNGGYAKMLVMFRYETKYRNGHIVLWRKATGKLFWQDAPDKEFMDSAGIAATNNKEP